MARVLRRSALDRYKETFKPKAGLLLPHLERHVMRTSAGAGERPDDHSLEYMHPSDMVKPEWCGRHDYYRMLGAPIEKNSQANPSFRMTNVFAEGHAIHDKYRTWLWEMGVLVGMFRCKDCGHCWYAVSPERCQFCLSERLVYAEYPLRHETFRVEGHADAAVHLPEFHALVEIKSIGVGTLMFEAPRLHQRYQNGEPFEDIWFDINRPFASHLRQGQLYLWMSWPVYERIIFIYESKAHQQTKEFVVEYNKALIAPLLATAKEVAQGYRAGIVPDRPLWAEGIDGKTCTSCEYRSTCWNGVSHGGEEEPANAEPIRVQRAKSSVRRRAVRSAQLRPA